MRTAARNKEMLEMLFTGLADLDPAAQYAHLYPNEIFTHRFWVSIRASPGDDLFAMWNRDDVYQYVRSSDSMWVMRQPQGSTRDADAGER